MIEAVLFDWNDTLVQFTWDDEVLVEGHRAAFAAIGRTEDVSSFTERYRRLLFAPESRDRPYDVLLRELLGALSDEEVDRFIDAEHACWLSATQPLGSARAMLEALRGRGLKTALVTNVWPDPPRILRADVERFGLADLFDAQVFSTELGVRKPHADMFLRALDELEVDAGDALYVGDQLEADVQGAAAVGMTTVQALWFRADDTPGIEPDFMAFTPMDVLNAVRRLALTG